MGQLPFRFWPIFPVDHSNYAIFVSQRQCEAIFGFSQHWFDRNAPICRFFLQRALEFLITVAEEGGAFSQFVRHISREERFAIGAIDAHADQNAFAVVETDAVAIVEGFFGIDRERAVANLDHFADQLANKSR